MLVSLYDIYTDKNFEPFKKQLETLKFDFMGEQKTLQAILDITRNNPDGNIADVFKNTSIDINHFDPISTKEHVQHGLNVQLSASLPLLNETGYSDIKAYLVKKMPDLAVILAQEPNEIFNVNLATLNTGGLKTIQDKIDNLPLVTLNDPHYAYFKDKLTKGNPDLADLLKSGNNVLYRMDIGDLDKNGKFALSSAPKPSPEEAYKHFKEESVLSLVLPENKSLTAKLAKEYPFMDAGAIDKVRALSSVSSNLEALNTIRISDPVKAPVNGNIDLAIASKHLASKITVTSDSTDVPPTGSALDKMIAKRHDLVARHDRNASVNADIYDDFEKTYAGQKAHKVAPEFISKTLSQFADSLEVRRNESQDYTNTFIAEYIKTLRDESKTLLEKGQSRNK